MLLRPAFEVVAIDELVVVARALHHRDRRRPALERAPHHGPKRRDARALTDEHERHRRRLGEREAAERTGEGDLRTGLEREQMRRPGSVRDQIDTDLELGILRTRRHRVCAYQRRITGDGQLAGDELPGRESERRARRELQEERARTGMMLQETRHGGAMHSTLGASVHAEHAYHRRARPRYTAGGNRQSIGVCPCATSAAFTCENGRDPMNDRCESGDGCALAITVWRVRSMSRPFFCA